MAPSLSRVTWLKWLIDGISWSVSVSVPSVDDQLDPGPPVSAGRVGAHTRDRRPFAERNVARWVVDDR
jgi:hypothetical protein